MSEADKPKKTALAQASEDAMVVGTMGGRMRVRWDGSAQATPHGQIVFFAEFLATAGVFDRWRVLLAYICQRIVGQIGLPTPPPTLWTHG